MPYKVNALIKRLAVHVLVAALFYSITCRSLGAQSTAEVSGTVKDQTGAVLPGVEVTATQTGTALKRSVVTDETGSFILTNLPVGPYRLEAALGGFRTFVQTGIVLQVGANPVINPVLEVGQVRAAANGAAQGQQQPDRSSQLHVVSLHQYRHEPVVSKYRRIDS